ncbi:MAG: hypothetical protein K2X69_16805 [Silvanigrellaceae bacterium]|nr:hypothetical protein [Silvanigrellaceae bacterium]
MIKNSILLSSVTLYLLTSCVLKGKEDKLVVNPPEVNSPSIPNNLNTKLFTVTKNNDGSYSTFKGSWTVPELVTSVKIIGCSGGNGGGGGGAGGAGAKFYDGNWSGASWGGNGSSGGSANNGSGNLGQPGFLGRYAQNNTWYNAAHSNGGYPQAESATLAGGSGGIGEQSYFGNYKFSAANENKSNLNNYIKISPYTDEEVCLGAIGGHGGAGGNGGKAVVDNNGDSSTETYIGGKGGDGANGQTGFHALVEEVTIKVTPGETIDIQVGQGGLGGNGSGQVTTGQSGSFGTNGTNGNKGTNGQSGKPGVVFIQWIGK